MSSAVPFVALERAHAPLRAELRAAFDRVIDASAFVLGAEVTAFEDEFAAYCGASHCVGVASGTGALILALEALGIGHGDEVIVPAHTFISSALAVLHAGATPVLCDVLPGTALIDPDAAASLVSERTSAVMAVHLYGQACDMDALGALAHARGLALIEDAAQAHGASWRDVRVGTLGTIGCFSFYPTKNLGALGEGGAVTTGDAELAARVRALRNIGQTRKGVHQLPGYNERLHGLQAALLRVKLPHLDRANAARRRHAAAYRASLAGAVRLVEETPASPSVHHLFPIRIDDRAVVAERLAQTGIQTGLHYHPALTGHAALDGRVRVPEPVPEAEAWAAEELSIPMFAEMTSAERAHVVAACLQAAGAVEARR
jgi:dTDP-4-amino-4,6-dideoxygalactose transaminase